MEYRRLGKAGIQLSTLSFGSWVTFHKQLDLENVVKCMSTAYEAGVNFFDNAEVYAKGEAERLMGEAIKQLGWRRSSYVISTKLFWGLNDGPNQKDTLNRKYLLEAIEGSLKRLQLEHVDLLYCHRPDPNTPIEETVWAMHDIVSKGYAHYWGTSEWSATQIEEAFVIAERLNLRAPSMEQPQYNMLHRDRLEQEYAPLFKKRQIGTTTWSPLASGILSGKYNQGIAAGTRLSLPGFEWLKDSVYSEANLEIAKKIATVAGDLQSTSAQLAIAWCAANKNVSSVILGATTLDQLKENLGASDTLKKLTPAVLSELDRILSSPGRK